MANVITFDRAWAEQASPWNFMARLWLLRRDGRILSRPGVTQTHITRRRPYKFGDQGSTSAKV